MDLERLGIIERVDPNEPNHWSSPVHFTLKGDGKSLRVVGDYRLLNQKTILDLYHVYGVSVEITDAKILVQNVRIGLSHLLIKMN